MKEIGIAEFEQLVMERLANPRNFAGRSLVLWNADYVGYNFVYRVIKQCIERYINENLNDKMLLKESGVDFKNDDYTQLKKTEMVLDNQIGEFVEKECHRELIFDVETGRFVEKGCHGELFFDIETASFVDKEGQVRRRADGEEERRGILLNSGRYRPDDQDDWLKFVNTHTNLHGGVSQDYAVIVCVQTDGPEFILKEEQFGENCDICHLHPTIEEWIKWEEHFQHYDAEILKVVRAYIEKNGVIRGFDYWMRILDALNGIKNTTHLVCLTNSHDFSTRNYKDCSLCQIPEDEVSQCIGRAVGVSHPAADFLKFIYENNLTD